MTPKGPETVAVIGAGPYGLAIAAHLRAREIRTHVFGAPLGYWRTHMPEGMHLKSSWAASSIASPSDELSLAAYERYRGAPLGRPIPISDFIDYGLWYQRRAVPDVDGRRVERIQRGGRFYSLALSDGEEFAASRVVLATGLDGFANVPESFGWLPVGLVSHTSDARRLSDFNGRRVIVIGAGQSALESAVLAHEAGADVTVLVRDETVHWLTRKARLDGTIGGKLYAPSDVGPAGLSWVVAAPWLMHRLPLSTRRAMIHRCLRPAVTGWLVPRSGGIRIRTGCGSFAAKPVPDGGVEVSFAGESVRADHILLGTGFRPRLGRVGLLADELRAKVRIRDGQPILGGGFETSVPGLHIVGALAADSFGPLPRFVAGTWFTAPELARWVAREPAPRASLTVTLSPAKREDVAPPVA
jgi:cation diffusion facilitator CzcD-associated flavoprotein CzcO